MDSGHLYLIEKWFSDHDGDGEFALHKRAVPYSVIGPTATAGGEILFTTKPTVVLADISDEDVGDGFALVGGYGLPRFADVHWIRTLAGTGKLSFLGDMDPVDLLIYAWLRRRLHPLDIAFRGIGDAFLRAMATNLDALPQIALAPSEQESLALLWQVFPDAGETVGLQCIKRLEDGFKLELEAVLSRARNGGSVLRLFVLKRNDRKRLAEILRTEGAASRQKGIRKHLSAKNVFVIHWSHSTSVFSVPLCLCG